MKLKYLLAASVVSLSAAAILPAPVMAQQITSGIEGDVVDANGAPLAPARPVPCPLVATASSVSTA
jgi:hypothetical protein